MAQLVGAQRYTPEGRVFDSPMESLEFYIDLSLTAAI